MPNDQKSNTHTVPTGDPVTALREAVAAIREAQDVIHDALSLSLGAGSGLAGIRVVMAARGLDDIQARLDEGWEILHLAYCDEIRELSGVTRQATRMAWVPYAILGKRAVMASPDRAAILADEERQLVERASPLTATSTFEAQDGLVGAAPTEDVSTPAPARDARGHFVQPHRTQVIGAGYEATGGLAGHR